MKKKRKLTNFGKGLLMFIIIIVTSLLFILIQKRYNDLKEQLSKCDSAKGYFCTLYEIKNFNE